MCHGVFHMIPAPEHSGFDPGCVFRVNKRRYSSYSADESI